jgi:hypothetical protein
VDLFALEATDAISSSAIDASTLEPPLTRWPTFTHKIASAGSSTVTREPNLISPTRWPRAKVSPSRQLKTMRRANNPATCLKVTSMSSPRTVAMFCSFRSAESGFMAFMYWPF